MNSRVSQLHISLEKEIELVQRFIAILQAESTALANANHDDALQSTTEEKNRYADLLAQSATGRDELLKQSGYSTDRQGIDSAMADHPALQATWVRLIELASQAKQLNAANGELIELYLRHNQTRLNALRNLTGGGNLYDANGRARNFSGGNKGIRAG